MKLLLLCLLFTSLCARAEDVSTAPYTIVTFGDSTTAPRGKLKVYSDWLAERLGSQNVRVINRGQPGDTTSAALKRFPAVLAEHPRLVIIQFGINDSAIDVWKTPPRTKPRVSLNDYDKNIRGFIHGVRKSGGSPILVTPNQLRWTPPMLERYGHLPAYDPHDEKGFSKSLSAYAECLRKIAREENVTLVDVYALYDEWEKTSQKSSGALLIDGMHPNSEGQRLVADALEPAILKIRKCQP